MCLCLRLPRRIKLSRFHLLGGSICKPLWTQWTVISSAYDRFCNTLGVMKKYWEVVPLHAVRTTMSNTLLSLTGSIPWLISSTTRKGAAVELLQGP
uniref:Uncharacterized protein n=1 Tax=Anguilla anguilla TaxID=7936 RepID=A0A0E9SNH8_ANGAN